MAGKQIYSTGELYTAASVNAEQRDRLENSNELLKDFLNNGKVIIGDSAFEGTAGSTNISISEGVGYIKQLDESIKRLEISSTIFEPNVSTTKRKVVTNHKIKDGTTPKVYKAFAVDNFIEREYVGEGDGATSIFDLKYVANGDETLPNAVYLNETIVPTSSWYFTTSSTGQSNKAIGFNTSIAEVITTNSNPSGWDLNGLVLKFNLFNPSTQAWSNIVVGFTETNPISSGVVAQAIQDEIDSAGLTPYYIASSEFHKIKIESLTTGFDKRIELLTTGSTAIGSGLLEYDPADLDKIKTGTGQVTTDDRVFVTYTKYFRDYFSNIDATDYQTINLNDDLTATTTENEAVPVLIEYEPDLDVYYGTDPWSYADLPSGGTSRYDIVYLEWVPSRLYHQQFFFDPENLSPFKSYSFSRELGDYRIKVHQGVASVSPARIDMEDILNTATGSSPFCLPIFEVLVDDSGIVSVSNNIIGQRSGTVGTNYIRVSDYRFYTENLSSLKNKELKVPIKQTESLSSGVASQSLSFNEYNGYVDDGDYVSIHNQNPAGDLIYRDASGAPAAENIDNLIFGIITNAEPGSEVVELYRGDPNGTYAAFTTGQAEDVIFKYYINSTLDKLPSDIFQTAASSGLAGDTGAINQLQTDLTKVNTDLNNIIKGNFTYNQYSETMTWTALSIFFRDIDSSGVNNCSAESTPVAVADGEYAYVVLQRDGGTVLNDEVKIHSNPWGQHPELEFDILILGRRAGSLFYISKDVYVDETDKVLSNLNLTIDNHPSYSGSEHLLKWSDIIEVRFRSLYGGVTSNTISANATGIALSADYDYAYFILNRDGATVVDDEIKVSQNPWADNDGSDYEIVILGQRRGSSTPSTFVETLGGGSGGGAGGEWVKEPELPSSFEAGTNDTLKINDSDNLKYNTYNDGRYLKISIEDSGESIVYAQVASSSWAAGVLTITIDNVTDIDGAAFSIPTAATLYSLNYSAMQMKYMGVVNDVNPNTTSLEAHVKDTSIHVTNERIYRVVNLSSQVGAGGTDLSFTLPGSAIEDTIVVYLNGFLLDASDYTVDTPSTFTINKNIESWEVVQASYVVFNSFHTLMFNDDLSSQSPGTDYTTSYSFNSYSLQVYRNGQLLPEGSTSSGYVVTGYNTFSLNTATESWEKIICHYDKDREGSPSIISLWIPGVAAAGTNKGKGLVAGTADITKVVAVCDSPPSGSDIEIDILVAPFGSSTYSSVFGSNPKLIISDGELDGQCVAFDAPHLYGGDRIRADILSVGSTSPGGDDIILNITLEN